MSKQRYREKTGEPCAKECLGSGCIAKALFPSFAFPYEPFAGFRAQRNACVCQAPPDVPLTGILRSLSSIWGLRSIANQRHPTPSIPCLACCRPQQGSNGTRSTDRRGSSRACELGFPRREGRSAALSLGRGRTSNAPVQWLGMMPCLVSKSFSSRAVRYIHSRPSSLGLGSEHLGSRQGRRNPHCVWRTPAHKLTCSWFVHSAARVRLHAQPLAHLMRGPTAATKHSAVSLAQFP